MADYGNIVMSDSELGKVNADAEAGNMTLKGATLGVLESDLDFGNLSIKESSVGEIHSNVEAGNANIEVSSLDKAEISAAFGNVIMTVHGEEKDYQLELDVEYGDVKVNGDKKGTHYSETSSTDKSIKINADSGDVNLKFE